MVSHGNGAMEVAKTVLEVADVAWTAYEHHHQHQTETRGYGNDDSRSLSSKKELEYLRSENQRLRRLLQRNVELLQSLTHNLCVIEDCPPDLYGRLIATLESDKFLTQLKSLHRASDGALQEISFTEATGDIQLVSVDAEEPSWWVWVSDEMVPSTVEEWSGIDDESYIIVSEEHVVDGVANFIARCILSCPKVKNLTPEELRKIVIRAVGGMNKLEKMLHIWHAGKLFYALATWGLALAGLYRSRAVMKLAAKGVIATSKAVVRSL